MKRILLSLLLVVSSLATAAEVRQDQVVLADNTTFSGQMAEHAASFVRSTANTLTAPFLSQQDVECLARNIFYEAGSEPLEGKVAVGMVTINRTQDDRYPQDICGVVKQRTVITVPQQVTQVKTVKEGWLLPPRQVVETRTQRVTRAIYQFSWVGQRNLRIREDDPRWIESRAVAEELARGGYETWQEKYSEAMNFHAVYVNPGWRLKRIGRVGNHIFYKGNAPVQQGG